MKKSDEVDKDLDRMAGLMLKKSYTISQLMKRLEVSERTAYRNIALLTERGHPVVKGAARPVRYHILAT
jgi:predicted DNA-binding transcriptional regulator YafY